MPSPLVAQSEPKLWPGPYPPHVLEPESLAVQVKPLRSGSGGGSSSDPDSSRVNRYHACYQLNKVQVTVVAIVEGPGGLTVRTHSIWTPLDQPVP